MDRLLGGVFSPMDSCWFRTKLKQPRSVAAPRAGRQTPLALISSLYVFQAPSPLRYFLVCFIRWVSGQKTVFYKLINWNEIPENASRKVVGVLDFRR